MLDDPVDNAGSVNSMRLAWFSPMPPVRTGIAAVSADLVAALGSQYEIDVYTHATAHDFVWRQRKRPYDLSIYQLGNSSHHDYMWPYLFRYPGLTVLHDAHLHHARAAALLRTKRPADYRAEFSANHPEGPLDVAELAIAGFDNHLYYSWPMNRLVINASKITAVHTPALAAVLREEHPGAHIEEIRLAHGEPTTPERAREGRSRIRARHGIEPDATVFGLFGGLTPEKRIPQVLDALEATLPHAPASRLLLAGAAPEHFDPLRGVRERGLDAHVTITGYVLDDELADYLSACDVSINLRWPSAREMSGPWLRAMALGLPTITTDLAHLADVPSLDPRDWSNRDAPAANREAVTAAIDILDEDHSLRLAMRRLATDPALRGSLGASARAYWAREHWMPRMVDDYRRAITRALGAPTPAPSLPPHLVNNGDATLRAVVREFGIDGERLFRQ
jgi:glycosyltransferase involved in cell wall biosynthesis